MKSTGAKIGDMVTLSASMLVGIAGVSLLLEGDWIYGCALSYCALKYMYVAVSRFTQSEWKAPNGAMDEDG